MSTRFRNFTKKVFVTINIIIAVLFLLGCANAFLHPERWWFIAILGLAFPFLLTTMVVFVVFWAFFRSKWVFLSVAVLLIGFTNIRALLSFHFGQRFLVQKDTSSIRILTWNVNRFANEGNDGTNRYRSGLLQIVKRELPDIICFQEYL